MKNSYILSLAILILLSSCSSKFGVMKRRYNKGYYVSVAGNRGTHTNHEPQAKAKATESKNDVVAVQHVNANPKQPVTPVQPTAPVQKQSVHPAASPEQQVSASAGKSHLNVFKARNLVKALKSQQRVTGGAASDTEPIVLIILCIFLPPLAVYLFHHAINADFWLSLILTLLFWVPGIIYAFLVCFGGVSIA